MTYVAAISTVLAAGIAAALATALLHHLVEFELRHLHHEVGSVVFLQLGVVFAVLVAFVFNEVWGEYNEAAHAIALEVSAVHGAAVIAATLEPANANMVLAAEKDYLEAVANREWPMLANNRTEDVETSRKLDAAIQDAANLRLTGPDQQNKKGEILSRLADAQKHRETRIFQAQSGMPIPLWCELIGFTVLMSLFVSFSGIKYRGTAAALAGCFTIGVVSILVVARLLDYPFEGALALQPTDYINVTGKISELISHVPER